MSNVLKEQTKKYGVCMYVCLRCTKHTIASYSNLNCFHLSSSWNLSQDRNTSIAENTGASVETSFATTYSFIDDFRHTIRINSFIEKPGTDCSLIDWGVYWCGWAIRASKISFFLSEKSGKVYFVQIGNQYMIFLAGF